MKQQTMDYQMWSFSASIPQLRESSGKPLQDPAATAETLTDMRRASQEMFVVLSLDMKNRVIDRTLVSLGTVNATVCHPREVFRPAIMNGAVSVIVAHNHPSGDPTPSAEDMKITRQLVEAGKIIGIPVLDHIVIGREEITPPGYLSMRDKGYLNFV